jgi:hypothetical protein
MLILFLFYFNFNVLFFINILDAFVKDKQFCDLFFYPLRDRKNPLMDKVLGKFLNLKSTNGKASIDFIKLKINKNINFIYIV